MTTKKTAPFGLRMGQALKEQLSEAAWENRRSLNAELCFRLERSLENEKTKEAT